MSSCFHYTSCETGLIGLLYALEIQHGNPLAEKDGVFLVTSAVIYTVKRFLLFWRRRRSTARPAGVRERTKNPCVLFRLRFFG